MREREGGRREIWDRRSNQKLSMSLRTHSRVVSEI